MKNGFKNHIIGLGEVAMVVAGTFGAIMAAGDLLAISDGETTLEERKGHLITNGAIAVAGIGGGIALNQVRSHNLTVSQSLECDLCSDMISRMAAESQLTEGDPAGEANAVESDGE